MEILNIQKHKQRNSEFGDIFLVMAIILGVAIFIIILSLAFSRIEPKMNEALTSSKAAEAGANVTKILGQTSTSLTRINLLFPLLIAGLFAFVMISALFLKSHPAFFFIGLIILAAALTLGAIYSNVFGNITEKEQFASTVADFNIMQLFMENLPIIILLFFVAMAIILWVKRPQAGGAY